MGPKRARGRPGRTPVQYRAAALASRPLGCSLTTKRESGMTSPYRIERDRGTEEARQQVAVLREKWPLAFPVKHQDIRPLAIGAAGEIAATMGWSLPYTLGVLHSWKMAPLYCQAVLCHDQRIALDGSPAEMVEPKAKDLATKHLARRAASTTAKKAAKSTAPTAVKRSRFWSTPRAPGRKMPRRATTCCVGFNISSRAAKSRAANCKT